MTKDSTKHTCDSVTEGHIEKTAGMTENNKSLVSESLNIFILIEHEFFVGLESGELDNLKSTYATFTSSKNGAACCKRAASSRYRFQPVDCGT